MSEAALTTCLPKAESGAAERSFALDEYVGLEADHEQSYRNVIHRDVIEPLRMNSKRMSSDRPSCAVTPRISGKRATGRKLRDSCILMDAVLCSLVK